MSVLTEILDAKRRRIAAGEFGPRGTPALASDGERFLRALQADGPSVIAELKHRSPSAGVILPEPAAALPCVAAAYRRGGAAAISVVIERDFFGGDPAWLPDAKRLSGLPVLMKDFVVDEVQLDFALSLGADAVLLIVSALSDADLASLHAAARTRGLAVLVEAHDADEARRALACGAEIVGINARDLKTFAVDLGGVAEIGRVLPGSVVRVAESGIRSGADVERLSAAGFSGFLVGESLLRSGDEARALRELRGEGTTLVKICGVTVEEDLAAVDGAGADYVGLNFSPLSPRRVGTGAGRALREKARWLKGVVAVFAGNRPEDVLRVAEEVRPDVLQITETPLEIGVSLWPLPVWQTLRVGRDDLEAARAFPGAAFLLDAPGAGVPGGTGRAWDWALLDGWERDRPVFVAGGLTPDNVAEAIRKVRPDGVDTASGVERAPGRKDPARVSAFVRAVRSAGRGESGVRAGGPRGG